MNPVRGSAEEWRAVPGFEGSYEVSDHGRVRSVDRVVAYKTGHPRRFKGKVLSPGTTKSGHKSVRLGKAGTHYVHRIVAAAFIGPCPDGMETCHNDGDPANNRLANLRYDTHANNAADASRHGVLRKPSGEKSRWAKLTDAQVAVIRGFRGQLTTREIAQRFDIDQSYAWRLLAGQYRAA